MRAVELSGKMAVLRHILRVAFAENDKVLIFSKRHSTLGRFARRSQPRRV